MTSIYSTRASQAWMSMTSIYSITTALARSSPRGKSMERHFVCLTRRRRWRERGGRRQGWGRARNCARDPRLGDVEGLVGSCGEAFNGEVEILPALELQNHISGPGNLIPGHGLLSLETEVALSVVWDVHGA